MMKCSSLKQMWNKDLKIKNLLSSHFLVSLKFFMLINNVHLCLYHALQLWCVDNREIGGGGEWGGGGRGGDWGQQSAQANLAACQGKNANCKYFALFPAYFSPCQQLHELSVKGKRVLKALCK
jgi:hypothetical protein